MEAAGGPIGLANGNSLTPVVGAMETGPVVAYQTWLFGGNPCLQVDS